MMSNVKPKQESKEPIPILKIYRNCPGLVQKEESTGLYEDVGHSSSNYRIAKPALSLGGKSIKMEQGKKSVKRKGNSTISSTSKSTQRLLASNHQESEHNVQQSRNRTELPDTQEPRSLTQKDYCEEILKALYSKKHAANTSPFFEPFGMKAPELQNYHKIIKQPMNLETVEAKLKNGIYNSHEEFADDVRLVFTNCYRYYPSHHGKIKMSQNLQEVFEIKYAQMPAGSIFQPSTLMKENYSDSSSNSVVASGDEGESPRLKAIQEQLKVTAKSMNDLELQMHDKKKRRELKKERTGSSKNIHALAQTSLSTKALKEREMKNDIALKQKSEKCELPPSGSGHIKEGYQAKPMSYNEMKQLSLGIARLTGDNLLKVADIVRSNDSFFDDSDPENVELNLEFLKPSTLRQLDAHVKSCLKKMAKKRYKTPTNDNPTRCLLSNTSTNDNAINKLKNSNYGQSLSSSDSEEDKLELDKIKTKEHQNSNPILHPSTSPSVASQITTFIRPPLMAMHNLPAQVEKPTTTTTCKKEATFQPIRHGLLNCAAYSTTPEVRQQRESPTFEVSERKIELQLRKSWPWSNLAQADTSCTCISNTVRESITYSTFQHFKRMAREKSEMSRTNSCHWKELVYEKQRIKSEANGITASEVSPPPQEVKQNSPIIKTPESLSPPLIELSDSFTLSPLSQSRERLKMLEQERRHRETNTHSTDILRQGEILEEFERANDIFYLKVKKWPS